MRFILLGVVCLLFLGCDGKNGTNGANGSQGPTGPAGPTVFQASFQNGVFPTSSYTGQIDTWINGGASTTSENSAPALEITTGTSYTNYARILIRFDVSSVPVNAQIISAELILKSETQTNIGTNPVTVGLHDLASSLLPTCVWTAGADWVTYNASNGWNSCDGDSSGGQLGLINPTTVSTVVLSSSANGQSNFYRWTIASSMVQNWLAGNNNGIILKSEGEFNESPSSLVRFFPYNDSTASNHPQLVLTYQ